MEYTEPADWINKPFEGYVVNTGFSEENKNQLMDLIESFNAEMGDAIFTMQSNSLHVTLLDWIAPLVDYGGQNKGELFNKIYPAYDNALAGILTTQAPISVLFDEIRVSPSTVLIVGKDNGEFADIRRRFISSVDLLPNTKQPPQIIHSSLLRFTQPLPLEKVQTLVNKLKINITQEIDNFRLVHTLREPMQEYEIVKRYELK